MVFSTDSRTDNAKSILKTESPRIAICLRWLLKCNRRSHPNHAMTSKPRGVRKNIYDPEREVQSYKWKPLDKEPIRHARVVFILMQSQMLWCWYKCCSLSPPPSLSAEVHRLPEQTRVILAQLGSG